MSENKKTGAFEAVNNMFLEAAEILNIPESYKKLYTSQGREVKLPLRSQLITGSFARFSKRIIP